MGILGPSQSSPPPHASSRTAVPLSGLFIVRFPSLVYIPPESLSWSPRLPFLEQCLVQGG